MRQKRQCTLYSPGVYRVQSKNLPQAPIMSDKANELTFQNEMIAQLLASGWQIGTQAGYNRELARYAGSHFTPLTS